MAGNNIGTLAAKATLDAQGFTIGADKMAARSKSLSKEIGSMFSKLNVGLGSFSGGGFDGISANIGDLASSFSRLGTAGKVGLAIGATVGAVFALEGAIKGYVRAGMDAIRMQDRLADQLGTTQAQAAAAIAVAGMSPEDVQSVSMKALRHIGELRQNLAEGGTGGAAGASLRALGLDPETFAAMPSWSQQLGIIGDRLKGVASGADRAAIAHAILGRGFEALLPQLRLGSEGMERYAHWADHFGVTVGGETRDSIRGTAAAARDFNVAQQMASDGLRNQFTAGFVEAGHGAQRYADATQKLIELQPQLANAMREAGQAAGTVMGGIESASVKILAGWNRIFDLFRDAPSPETPQQTRAQMQRELAARREDAEIATRRMRRSDNIDDRNLHAGRLIEARMRIAQLEARLNPANSPIPANAPIGIQAWEMEASAGNAPLTNSIADATEALHRQNDVYGLYAESVQRLRFAQQGASDAQLASIDKEIAKLRERQRAERDSENLMRLQNISTTPLDTLRARVADIQAQGGFMNNRQRGAALLESMGGIGRLQALQESTLLGSMSANTAETASILQGAQQPQIELAQAANALLRSLVEQAEETNRINEELGDAVDGIQSWLDSMVGA